MVNSSWFIVRRQKKSATNCELRTANQSGQAVIILLLVMVLALAIGLSVIGRSVTEISTSTKTEDSSRAFSAAEAGIERLLQLAPQSGSGTAGSIDFSNQSQAQGLQWTADLPKPGLALEYPPFGKESFAQFWLANPLTLASAYNLDSFDIYFGDPMQDYSAITGKPDNQPAIEVSVVLYAPSGSSYYSKSYFFDSKNDRAGAGGNNFSSCNLGPSPIGTNAYSELRSFYCKATVTGYKNNPGDVPIMVRARMLYTSTSHPAAIHPASGGSFPFQASVFQSTGVSGGVARNLQIFQQKWVLPQIFDYALFSAGDLSK